MRSKVLRIVAIYATAGLLWIGLSDVLFIQSASKEGHRLLYLCTVSAIIFVAATSAVLYKLISLHYSRLHESEKQYRSYFEENPTPMWIYSRKTLKFIAVNEAAIDNYGYSREEFSHLTVLDIRPADEIEKAKAALAEFQGSYKNSGTWKHRRKDGSDIYVSITSHLVFSSDKENVMVMAKDVTQRVQTEQQIQHANQELVKQNNILREISWSQSHNVRKPLATILGLLNVMRVTSDAQEKELCVNYIEISACELDIMIHEISEQISAAVVYD